MPNDVRVFASEYDAAQWLTSIIDGVRGVVADVRTMVVPNTCVRGQEHRNRAATPTNASTKKPEENLDSQQIPI
jgi:hypothetical protein